MTDPRAPVDIATFRMEMQANMFAAMLRDEGIQAAVFGAGASLAGMVQDSSSWRLMVPAEDADRARQIIVESREGGDAAKLPTCPGCGYSLDGLEQSELCPECGRELQPDRNDKKVSGLVHTRTVSPRKNWAWVMLIVALLICGLVGLISIFMPEHR